MAHLGGIYNSVLLAQDYSVKIYALKVTEGLEWVVKCISVYLRIVWHTICHCKM